MTFVRLGLTPPKVYLSRGYSNPPLPVDELETRGLPRVANQSTPLAHLSQTEQKASISSNSSNLTFKPKPPSKYYPLLGHEKYSKVTIFVSIRAQNLNEN